MSVVSFRKICTRIVFLEWQLGQNPVLSGIAGKKGASTRYSLAVGSDQGTGGSAHPGWSRWRTASMNSGTRSIDARSVPPAEQSDFTHP
jgi:hypothetical protein